MVFTESICTNSRWMIFPFALNVVPYLRTRSMPCSTVHDFVQGGRATKILWKSVGGKLVYGELHNQKYSGRTWKSGALLQPRTVVPFYLSSLAIKKRRAVNRFQEFLLSKGKNTYSAKGFYNCMSTILVNYNHSTRFPWLKMEQIRTKLITVNYNNFLINNRISTKLSSIMCDIILYRCYSLILLVWI